MLLLGSFGMFYNMGCYCQQKAQAEGQVAGEEEEEEEEGGCWGCFAQRKHHICPPSNPISAALWGSLRTTWLQN